MLSQYTHQCSIISDNKIFIHDTLAKIDMARMYGRGLCSQSLAERLPAGSTLRWLSVLPDRRHREDRSFGVRRLTC